ncbi:MAG: hypothetical protein QF457_09780 [SAR324 cluster bacterium]|nr:hypothetical protein [SAR324 cluster bacterium]
MPGIFLELELESACILESGVYRFSTNLTRSNTTTISPDNNLIYPRLILDHEREEVMVKVEVGLGSDWDLRVRAAVRAASGNLGIWKSGILAIWTPGNLESKK